MSQLPARRPGDRVIRRRFKASKTIDLPHAIERQGVPNVRHHAKLFSLALVAVVFIATALLALPWSSRSGESTSVIDAFFTAVSAFCVTGLIVVDTQTHWSFFGQLIILLLIQAGGLGFMVGASIVLRILQRGASTGLRETLLLQDGAPTLSLREAASLSGRITRFTLIVEAVGAAILFIYFLIGDDKPAHTALWHGIFYSISSFCNAGFDLQGQYSSLIDYRSSIIVNLTVLVLVQAGALSFMFFADINAKRRWKTFALETKIIMVANGLVAAVGTTVFLAAEWNQTLASISIIERPLVAFFQGAAGRTAGFSTVDIADLTSITLFSWVAIMFIGGASASTAGGVKLTTVGVIGLAVVSTIRGQQEPQVFGRRIPTPLIFRAMAVVTLMFLAHFIATLALTITQHYGARDFTFLSLLFETMSAIATVGLTTGITPMLSDPAKLILCVTMIFGRLGPLTVVYALQIRQHPVRYRFPEEPIRIG
jgi:trk system potassium uptake protein TrkH